MTSRLLIHLPYFRNKCGGEMRKALDKTMNLILLRKLFLSTLLYGTISNSSPVSKNHFEFKKDQNQWPYSRFIQSLNKLLKDSYYENLQ